MMQQWNLLVFHCHKLLLIGIFRLDLVTAVEKSCTYVYTYFQYCVEFVRDISTEVTKSCPSKHLLNAIQK